MVDVRAPFGKPEIDVRQIALECDLSSIRRMIDYGALYEWFIPEMMGIYKKLEELVS